MNNENMRYDISTTDPLEDQEGSGAKVPPPHTCLQAVGDSNGHSESCRSQGNQGPCPGYHTRGLSLEEEEANPTPSGCKSKGGNKQNNETENEKEETPMMAKTYPTIAGDRNEEKGGRDAAEPQEHNLETNETPESQLRDALEAWNTHTSQTSWDNQDMEEFETLEKIFEDLNKPFESTVREMECNHETTGQDAINNTENTSPAKQKRNKKRKQRTKKANKASTQIGTLNIRGFGDPNVLSKKNKWLHINQIMRDRTYGILAVQETHMNQDRCEEINRIHGNRFKVYGSHSPENPTARGGVAIVIKQDKFTNPEPVLVKDIVPGRAILTKMKWHKTVDAEGKEKWTHLTVLAIYAPNVTKHDGTENARFWEEINQYFENHPNVTKPDVMLGDCNMVENPSLDRLPKRNDPADAREALDTLKMNLGLGDGWREEFPDTREYTFTQQATGSASRLDRIYMTSKIREKARDWKNNPSPFKGADHNAVSVRISCEKAPEYGKGRPQIPVHLTEDKQLLEYAIKVGIEALRNIEAIEERTEEDNAQLELFRWKNKVFAKAREREKKVKPRLERKQEELTRKLQTHLNDPKMNDEEKIKTGIEIVTELANIEQQKHSWKRDQLNAKNRLEGETICRYWMDASKDKKPRDVIHALEIKESEPRPQEQTPEPENGNSDGRQTGTAEQQNPTTEEEESILIGETRDTRKKYETDPKRMAELARNYHDKLQIDGMENTHPERDQIIEKTLSNLETELNLDQQEEIGQNMDTNLVTLALILAENGTSAGIDGIPNELFKAVQKKGKENEKRSEDSQFNMIRLLTEAFVDIEEYGVVKATNFTEGWMCPIYKKKEKTKVENYRPITLLNTDYKLFTKALALKLAKVAPHLLHKNQAGFVPGRAITDQTQLIRMIATYAEVREENGLIVVLDQEKAYDKIAHDYLWKTLRTFKFPEKFINTIRALYASAETKVMVNGHMSSSFRITRGVRQGDPMSCILFDLAIEPLGAMIRNSNLKGYKIGEPEPERTIVNMFADDTTVFLARDDNLETLKQITDEWCITSRARFNESKTEIIPVGSKTYREEVISTRKTSPHVPGIPEDKHIAKEGEAIRILGAWFGNNIDQEGIWTPTLEKIDECLKRWEKTNPTMEGRRHIAQIVIGGMTQYLTKVQGMPTEVRKRLEKRENRFIWNEKGHPPVSTATIQKQIEEGGRKVLDLESRNEAIKITWVQAYMNLTERPTWAKVADEIYKCFTTKAKKLPRDALINPILQSWKPNLSTTTKLPRELAEILRTATKYNLNLDGIKIAKKAVDAMPIWYHAKADHKKMHAMAGGMISACLRKNHGVMNAGQAQITSILTNIQDHKPEPNCKCHGCESDRNTLGCKHPHWCAERAENLLNLLPEKWDPREATEELEERIKGEKDWTTIEPKLTTAPSIHDAIRIFDDREEAEKSDTAVIETEIKTHDGERNPQRVATDGSCINNGYENAIAGAGVYFGKRDQRNTAVRLPSDLEQSNQTGELIAIKIAIEKTDLGNELWIESDSKYAIDSITKNRESNEDKGYIDTNHAEIIKDIVIGIRRRTARTLIKWVKGHSGYEPNEKADMLANEGVKKATPDQMSDWTERRLTLGGAKLKKITQALAYKKIRKMKDNEVGERKRTAETMKLVKAQTEETFGIIPTEKAIWKSIRLKENSMKTRHFLWMMAHDTYMVGDKWLRDSTKDEHRARAECTHCEGKIESMKHIMAECDSPGQNVIWELAKQTWERKSKHKWIKPHIGTTIGAGLATVRNPETLRPKPGENRLWRIMISESAHLIWKLRCERVIEKDNNPFTPNEIKVRWETMMNERIKLDRLLTNRTRFKNKAMSEEKVKNTWRHTLKNEGSLPTDWVKKTGVLVGIETDLVRKRGKRRRKRASQTPDWTAQARLTVERDDEESADV